jgi:hypothetical protein
MTHENNEFAAYRTKRVMERGLYRYDIDECRTPNFGWWLAGAVLGLVFWLLVFWLAM